MRLEVGEQSEEDGEREFEDLRHGGDAVLGQGHTQVLLDGVDEHLVSLEDGPSVLQDGEEQLEGQDLRSQLMGPEASGERKKKLETICVKSGGGQSEYFNREGHDDTLKKLNHSNRGKTDSVYFCA